MESRKNLSLWVYKLHEEVNKMLGKKIWVKLCRCSSTL